MSLTAWPIFPIYGLPVAEWLAALEAVRAVEGIDHRILEVRVLNGGGLFVRTGEILHGLNGRGHELLLRRGEGGWSVVRSTWWAS